MLLDSPPEPLELWEMFDQVAPSTWAEHQLSISKVENPLMTSDDLG
jgi:hypothetical protein